MFRVAYKLKPFIFYIVFSIVRGCFISKNKLTPGVVAQTYNIAIGLVLCTLVQSQMYEYLKHMEYPPERGYDRKILESNCKIGRVNLKICTLQR